MDFASEKSIFLEALEYESTAERRAYLAKACGRDPKLLKAVEGLLAGHALPGNPLDHTPDAVRPLVGQLEKAERFLPELTASSEGIGGRRSGRPIGSVVGPYKLLEMIGEGGFGLVYVAEQQQPVRRRVALKLIKPGMESREVIARFEAERQALAMMDHPNIARVFDGGATAEGQPYFVMELVRGIPLTHFCDKNRRTTRERLQLFIDVCNAVQHAHQKGVIHRDLKPSNVLITLHDGSAVVKVIDFGVAKAISEPLTEKTLYTRFAQIIGTPLYMSPEQAEKSGLDVDTRSDIYSLGVMLYELLTGSTPFDNNRLKTLDFDELRRIIREEEPPRPSARLTTLTQVLSTISSDRQTDPRALFALLRGDLDWIVMKALEKDRRRRYATAAEFADDLRRFLAEEPISARPPSLSYQFGKFARRNKVALTTASVVILALLLGTGVSVWQAIRANSARAEADSLRQDAVDFANRLKQANVLLDNARANTDEGNYRLAQAEYTKAAQLQPDHYLVWSGRGSLYVRLGMWHLAAKDYARALQLGAPANNPAWWGVPPLCLYAGETTAYDAACRTLRRQLDHSSDPLFTSLAIRNCLIGPTSSSDTVALADRAMRLLQEPLPGPTWPGLFGDRPGRDASLPNKGVAPTPPHFGGPTIPDFRLQFMRYVAGLAEYRAGNFKPAIELLESTIGDNWQWSRQAIAYPVLAMAYHRAGRGTDAADALKKAKVALDEWTIKFVEGSAKSLSIPEFDFIECIVLTREANKQILGETLPDDPRLTAIERRAAEQLNRE